MKLSLLYISVGILSVLLQTTVLHFLPFGFIVPDLALVLCVYWGLHHPTVGAVLGSFILGYSVDVFSSPPLLGLNTFSMSLVFLASWVKSAALIIAWTLFLTVDSLWVVVLKYIFLEAIVAAVMAPFVFFLLRRGHNYLEEAPNPL